MYNKRRKEKSLITIIAMVVVLLSGTWHWLNNKTANLQNNTTNQTQVEKQNTANLAKSDYENGTNPVIKINNDQPTIKAVDFNASQIKFSNLDQSNRAQKATAYLTNANLGRSEGRESQTWEPTGWHNQPKEINGERIFPQNRGHLIAYTLSFNLNQNGQPENGASGSQDNPKNLFTQSAYSNQKLMQETEGIVREALEAHKKVIYEVTPVYKNNELMARGVHVQAISTDQTVKFNRYIYNVQPGISFDYQTGRSRYDSSVKIPE